LGDVVIFFPRPTGGLCGALCGGGGGGGVIFSLILLPFFAIYSAIVSYLIYRKHK
jgi:hypothetical protein